MCERLVDLLLCSLPLHRHSYIGFILSFASSIHNKQIGSLRMFPINSLVFMKELTYLYTPVQIFQSSQNFCNFVFPIIHFVSELVQMKTFENSVAVPKLCCNKVSDLKLQRTHNVWTFPCFLERDHLRTCRKMENTILEKSVGTELCRCGTKPTK